MSNDFYATYPVQSGGGASWAKFTLPYTAINTLPGTDTGQINVFTVPAGYAVIATAYNTTATFTGAGTVACNIGWENNFAAYQQIANLVNSPFGGTASGNGQLVLSFTSVEHITVNIVVSTALSDLNAGSIDIYALIQNMNGG